MLHDKELLNYIVNFKTNSIQLSFDNNITLEFKNIFIYKVLWRVYYGQREE